MYTKYYGFNEKPFTLTPNPRFIYLSKNHKEAFAHLLYGINNHYGFIELIGEVGTGKTTVLRTLLGQLHDENYRTALIVNPCVTGVELLRTINSEFGINAGSEYANDLLADLNRFLLHETSEGRTVVLVIDESQNLKSDVLEQIRLISNLETESDKLIQIILAGQPELEALLERPELRQLNQRIAVRYRLKSMSMEETRAYIRHRMEVAGETGGVFFSRYAVKWIYLYTRGVPRMINILCDRALLIGYTDERRRITSGIISRAIREILNVRQGRQFSVVLAASLSIIVICIILFYTYNRWLPAETGITRKEPQISSTKNNAVVPITSNSETKQQPNILHEKILSYDLQGFHIQAFNAIAGRWGVRPIRVMSGNLTVPGAYARLAEKRNLRITAFKGTLDQVIRFNIPFIVVTKVPGVFDKYCLAVTSVKNDSVTVSPALFNSNIVAKKDLAAISSGIFYLVWQNVGQIPDRIHFDEKRFEIHTLQQLLKRADKYHGMINGRYDSLTASAIREFQRVMVIPSDESVGELTVAALTQFDSDHNIPLLMYPGKNQ